MREMLNDWDIDNIVASHIGNKIGGAKEQLLATLEEAIPSLELLSQKRANKGTIEETCEPDDNIEGCECG